jgi:SAM-dependent methyltransferase
MWKKRLRLVGKFTSGGRLLDVGAGIGTFPAFAREVAGFEVKATEISRDAVRLAEDLYGLSMFHGQLEDLPIQDGEFDVITLWHVLEHAPSPSSLLRRCHSALRPGGRIFVAVPNDDDAAFLPGRVKRGIGGFRRVKGVATPRYYPLRPGLEVHLCHFRTQVLRHALEVAGFAVLQVSVDDHYPEPSRSTNLRVHVARGVLRLTGVNFGQATIAVAEKRER